MKMLIQKIAPLLILLFFLQSISPAATLRADKKEYSPEPNALSLPEGKAGTEYEYQLTAEGGLPPLTWKLIEGDLPPGIKLEASGELRGTPVMPSRDPYGFVIEVSDSSQPRQVFSQPFALMIHAAPLRMVMTPARLKITPPKHISSEISDAERESQSSQVTTAGDADSRSQVKVLSSHLTNMETWTAPPRSARAVEDAKATSSNASASNNRSIFDPARYIKIYESPKVPDPENPTNYGKLIYDPTKRGLDRIKLTADEASTIVIVPAPENEDLLLNNLYMTAQLVSGDKSSNIEVKNYSEIGEDKADSNAQLGASFETARNMMFKVLTLQRISSEIIKYTYRVYDNIPPKDELTDEEFAVADEKSRTDATVRDEILSRAREKLNKFQREIKEANDFILAPKNRGVVTIIATEVFSVDRDTMRAISQQINEDLEKVLGVGNPDISTQIRLLGRVRDAYRMLRSAREQVRLMATNIDNYNPPRRSQTDERNMLEKELMDIQRAGGSSDVARDLATRIYALDRASAALGILKDKFLPGYVSLFKARAQDGDTLYLTVQAQNLEGEGLGASVPFEIAVKRYGAKLHLGTSFMFIKRLGLTEKDIATPENGGLGLKEVNFAPSPGMTFGITYFKRGENASDKLLRALAPTFGINVSFMNFNDPGFDLEKEMFTNTKGTDVQVGAGPVVSLFNNKLHFTYGWNLNVDERRSYFGIGFGFLEVGKAVGKYLTGSTNTNQ